jgi:hypothetical protein
MLDYQREINVPGSIPFFATKTLCTSMWVGDFREQHKNYGVHDSRMDTAFSTERVDPLNPFFAAGDIK